MLDSATLHNVIRPGTHIQVEKAEAEQKKDTATEYEYTVILYNRTKSKNGGISTHLPAISLDGVKWESALTYGLGYDTSDLLARYSGVMREGTTVTQARGSTVYAKTTTTTQLSATETYTAYQSGMLLKLSIERDKERNKLTVDYSYSVPTSTATPPNLLTSSYTGSAYIDTSVVLAGLTYYQKKGAWYLLGFNKTYEEINTDMKITIKRKDKVNK